MTTYSIDPKTLDVLSSFCDINPNILIKAGNLVSTVSPAMNMLARYSSATTFPVEFGIYDLKQFLSCVKFFSEPVFDFGDRAVVIYERGDKRKRVNYIYSSPNVLKYQTKEFSPPKFDFNFSLTKENMSNIKKSAGIFSNTLLFFQKESGSGLLSIGSIHNYEVDKYSQKLLPTANHNGLVIDVPITGDNPNHIEEEFCLFLNFELWSMVPLNYSASVSSASVLRFQAEGDEDYSGLVYYMAGCPNSFFSRNAKGK